jgi:hypothetical protein
VYLTGVLLMGVYLRNLRRPLKYMPARDITL